MASTPRRGGAEIRIGPEMRRGIAELDGEGEVVGGVVVMRFGENARRTIDAVKAKLALFSLPTYASSAVDEPTTPRCTAKSAIATIRAAKRTRHRGMLRQVLVNPAKRAE